MSSKGRSGLELDLPLRPEPALDLGAPLWPRVELVVEEIARLLIQSQTSSAISPGSVP